MKVLLISNMYPSKKYPHYGVFVQNTEKILLEIEDVTLHKIVVKKSEKKILKILQYMWFYIRIIIYGLFGNYDILYGHFISHIAIPLLIVKKFNHKSHLIVNVHGNDVVPDEKKDVRWIPFVEKILPKVDCIIVPSPYFKDIMIKNFQVSEESIHIFPSGGIDINKFYPKKSQDLYKKYKLDSKKHYIGYVARIEKDKGWDSYIYMVDRLKDQRDLGFIVVGDGVEKEKYNMLIKELGLKSIIKEYGLLSQEEISELFSIMDVFCFPTYRKSESLGLVGLEAMACGTIVVGPNKGGPATYIINGENGYTCDTKNYQELAEKVIQVMNLSDNKRKKMVENALETALSYEQSKVSEQLKMIFKHLLVK